MENRPKVSTTHSPTFVGGQLPYESLDAWKIAREIVAFITARKARLRGLPGELAGHIERSSVSAAMNIAEASGRLAVRDRKSRSSIARGEASEAAAGLDLATLHGALEQDEFEHVRGLSVRLVLILSKLAS